MHFLCDSFDVTRPELIKISGLVHMAALWCCSWYESRKYKGDMTSNGILFIPDFMKFVSFFEN